jgi:hypothetical protein
MPNPHDVATLYRAPIEGFIAARDSLAARLREDGRADEAAAVKALRKPTVPAWAIDQLAHADAKGVGELLEAGAEVHAAQQATLTSPRAAERLRAATTARRAVIARLVAAAEEVLRRSDRDPTSHVEAIAATLEAASADPELGDLLRAGTLDRPAVATGGFGDVLGLRLAPEPGEGASSSRRTAKARGGAREAADDPAGRVEAGRLRRDRDAAAREARRSREAADALGERLAAAEDRLRELRERFDEARGRAMEAETAEARAQAALDRASGTGRGGRGKTSRRR